MQPWLEQRASFLSKEPLPHTPTTSWKSSTPPDNIERIATLIDECLGRSPKTVSFTLHTIQAPAPLLRDLTRQTTTSANDADMLAAVEAAVARGEASYIDSIFLETKSGTRAIHKSAREHVYLSDFGTNAKGLPTLAFEMRPVGSIFEIDPPSEPDGRTVEITLSHELHPAAPQFVVITSAIPPPTNPSTCP